MALLLFYLFMALFVSFLCSIMEAVLLSTPLSYLKVEQENGHSYADDLIELKTDVDRPLSAILSLNTVAHTIGAAGVGAQANLVFGQQYFAVVAGVLTFLILVFTEIIPKTIGARYWKNICRISGPVLRGMIFITYPLVIMSSYITRKDSAEPDEGTISRDEIAALANIGTSEGVFGKTENLIIQNLLRLKTIRVSEILTPRVVMVSADENMELKEFLLQRNLLKFTRIPVYSEKEENITGYVFRHRVFEKLAESEVEEQESLGLKSISRPIVSVPFTLHVFKLWELLLQKKEHIAVVIDEYGGIDGVVTMEDIIETLLGFEIVDEKDSVTDMQQYARQRWKVRQEKYKYIDLV